jgi:predicted acylesterase/phospholipase RssA
MSQRGLSVRFWVFLVIAIMAGVISFHFLIVLMPIRASRALLLGAAMAIGQFAWTIIALLIAITAGSAVWNLLYWLSPSVPLLTERLELAEFGSAESVEQAPDWVKSRVKNAGTLQEFLRLGKNPEFRIGIVLAGGGAKGVYQAGAVRALWEFLQAENALQYVRMIAGTSIGSWNSMFWLTRQVEDGNWDHGPLYEWWTSSRLSTVVNPVIYIPILRNYLAGNHVWRRQFTALFSSKACNAPPYLYLTRTNVGSGALEFTTTRKPQGNPAGTLPNYRGLANSPPSEDASLGTKQLESAVFASMDIPPAFRRLEDVRGNQYEDGGVIDNLPIRFATWCEGCNLLFVFPLNATFAESVSNVSISARMARVLDTRQGVLERDALKDISLYNRIIEAEQEKETLAKAAPGATAHPSGKKLTAVHTVPCTTFCICPAPKLKVGTFGFGSLKRHGRECFKLMYEATQRELAKFDFSLGNREIWMAKVGPDERVTYEDFTLR